LRHYRHPTGILGANEERAGKGVGPIAASNDFKMGNTAFAGWISVRQDLSVAADPK